MTRTKSIRVVVDDKGKTEAQEQVELTEVRYSYP